MRDSVLTQKQQPEWEIVRPVKGCDRTRASSLARPLPMCAAALFAAVVLLPAPALAQSAKSKDSIAAALDELQPASSGGPDALTASAAVPVGGGGDWSTKAVLEAGDTLAELLASFGVSRREVHAAVHAMADIFSPRRIRAGQEISLLLEPEEDNSERKRLLGLRMRPNVEQDLEVRRDGDRYVAQAIRRQLFPSLNAVEGEIRRSLFADASEHDIPPTTLASMIRAFSFDVDFQRELQPGDRFELLFETLHELDGRLAKPGDLLYAQLVLSGKRHGIYRFTPKSGITDYFTADGHSVRRSLLRTPIDGARISSGYGMRRHPILGYSKMHKGVDFAAPKGTPVFAAGDGIVETAGRNGGYGKYVRIRHSGSYKTAYAHLSRYGRGIKAGTRVKQGQVIGYVGSTGRSTGPHLHYEVLSGKKQVNPRSLKLPAGERLKGKDLARFQQERERIDVLRERHRPQGTVLAVR